MTADALAPAPPAHRAGSFLTLHYRLAGPAGDVINTFDDKPATLSLGTGELSPAMEQRLIGLAEGTRTRFELAAGEAFGERNPDMLQWVARKLLNELGDPTSSTRGRRGAVPHARRRGQLPARWCRCAATRRAFDFNHPLAGQPVTFEVQLIGVL
jgi:FKBP-type peptidyl-prolyl cis-trans isomerase SlpA